VSYTGSQYFDAGNSVEIAQENDVTLVKVALNDERLAVLPELERHVTAAS
jgi:hypothetical protein